VSKGSRLAIIAGLAVAVVVGAAIVAISAIQSPSNPIVPKAENTTGQPRQIEIKLNENLTVKAK
jgi:hypothetical protein